MVMKLDDNRTPDGLFKVSQSKVKQWRNCRRQWWYAHVMKIQRQRIPRPLAFGKIVHKMKEEMAQGRDPYQVLDELPRKDLETYADHPEEYGDIVEDIRYIFEAYNVFYKGNQLIYLKHDKRQAEHPFEVETGDDIVVKGTIDAATSHRRMNWLTEHKNHRNIPDDDERWRSVQSVVYIRILEMLGWWKNIEGTCWDYIRSKAPSYPEINKDGSVSKRKLDTLPGVVKDTLRQHKQDPQYKILVDAATLNMQNYFQRVYTPIKKQLIKVLWEDFLSTAAEMRDADYRKEPVMTIGRHCSWCQFEPLCRAAMTGGDVDYLIEHDYEPNTYGDNHETSEST
jgi:PD-(D/E)XK nuclease superfamily